MASHIQKWAEHTHRTTTKRARVLQPVHRRKGGVRASDGDNDHSEEEEEDFEAGLIIPDDGHLSLHLSRHSRSASGHETAMSTSGASSTTGSGALLFSSDSEQQPPEADTDADGDRSRSASVNAGAAGGANEDEDAEDERGSTLKANQLPASFATQLALAKAQAALAKVDAATAAGVAVATVTASSAVLASADTPGQVRNLGRIVTKTSPQQAMDWEEDIEGLRAANLAVRRPVVKQASFTSHISDSGDEDEGVPSSRSGKSKMEQARSTAYKAPVKAVDDDDDIESDFDLPEAVQQVKLSTSNRREPSTASSFFAQGSSTAASSLRRLDANNRGPKSRQASSTDDAEFFDDIVLPTYLGGPAVAAGPSQAGKSSAKIDLQALLNLKLQRKIESPADSGSPSLSPPRNQFPSRSSLGSGIRAGTTGSLRSRYREAPSEDFEDGLVLDEPAGGLGESTVAHHGSPVRRGGSGFQPRGIQAQRTTSSRGDHLAPLGIPTSSRTARTSTRSRSNDGTALPAMPRSPSGLPLSGQSSQQQHDRAPGLRSRPSLSNLSTRSASPALAPPLGRKKSIPFLSAAAADSARPASPQIPARYAQPTRSFLARAHSLEPSSSYGSLTGFAQATMSHQSHIRSTLTAQSGSGYRPASPQVVTANATASALPSSSSLSRLNQPTASSRAKSRVAQGQATPTGADPSGRSSASLGRPLLSSYSHSQGAHVGPLPLARELRRPVLPPRARTRSGLSHEHLAGFGDGTELDGFDDLPINQEKEKRFLRAPRRRESSGGTDITTVAASPGTGPTLRGGRKGAVEPQQQKQLRERMESAPDKLQSNALRRRLANASGGSAHSETSSGASQIQTLSRRGTTGSSAKTASVEARRPRLQLIKGLNAAGLSKVQGEMKWNPILMKWEGNETSLREFDNVMASSSRPALISPVFGPMSPRHTYSRSPLSTPPAGTADSKASIDGPSANVSNELQGATPQLGGVRVVGDMIFDPVRMSWFTTSASGEEELDFGSDEGGDASGTGNTSVSTAATSLSGSAASAGASRSGAPVDAWEGGENMRLKTRRSFAHDWGSNASESGADGAQDDAEPEWDAAAFKEATLAAAARHEKGMEAWRNLKSRSAVSAKDSDASRRGHLWSIRDIVEE